MSDTISYERLVEKALLSVVRDALKIAGTDGLPGNHHFYITFKTRREGVVLSDRLIQAYPEEMTIVLQHEFSNLEITDKSFSVTLSFGNIPERITIPFDAVASFADPHAQVAVSFQVDLKQKNLLPLRKKQRRRKRNRRRKTAKMTMSSVSARSGKRSDSCFSLPLHRCAGYTPNPFRCVTVFSAFPPLFSKTWHLKRFGMFRICCAGIICRRFVRFLMTAKPRQTNALPLWNS